MPAEVEARLNRLGLALPAVPRPVAQFLPFRRSGALVFLAGQTCEREGRVLYAGLVSSDADVPSAREAARVCALNLLAALRMACDGDLDRVDACVRVGGFVQAAPRFGQVPQIIDGASELFIALWDERGRHARTAVGVATLPQNATVEVDAIFALRP